MRVTTVAGDDLLPQLGELYVRQGEHLPGIGTVDGAHSLARRGLIPPGSVMVCAPGDDVEVDVVAGLVRASWAYARGAS